jgi:ribosomal protein S18 acetylase RimI-like enzyme
MIDQLTVRPATLADADTAALVWLETMEVLSATDSRYQLAPDATAQWSAGFRVALEKPQCGLFVAIRRGTVMGYIWGETRANTPGLLPTQIGYVLDLAADTHGHGGGVGTLLWGALSEWFQAQGLTRIEVNIPVGHAIAQAFWRAKRVNRWMDTVSLKLPE